MEFEKKACKSSKVLQRFLKKANVEGGNEGNEELVAHEGNDDFKIALIGDGNEIEDDDESIRSSLHHNLRQMMLLLTCTPTSASALTCNDVGYLNLDQMNHHAHCMYVWCAQYINSKLL